MKRLYWNLFLLFLTAPLLAAQTPAATHPVYIYLYSRVTDHVNLDITEDRLRRLLPMIEHYRADHPEARVSATILFSGAASEALAQRNSKTGIKDFVLGYKKRGVIEVGYDGTDEPTYENRPMVRQIDNETAQERWLTRAAADEKLLTEGRNPLTGAPEPGSVGGLQAMQQVFGEASCITGASVGVERQNPKADPKMPGAGPTPTVKPEIGDWEIVPVLRRYNTKAIMFGLPESNPAHIPGFNGSVMGIGRLMSPVPEASPDLFWADNILRSSESGGGGGHVIRGYDGSGGLKDFMGKLDRSKIRILHMELGSEKDYLKPDFAKTALSASLSYAYAHPDNPTLPADARLTSDEVNAAYAKEESTLKWMVTDYFPANPGSSFVSSSDLQRMTPPSTGYSLSVETLRAELKQTLADWGNDTFPPSYIRIDGHYLSLADTFQVMTDALADFDRTGKLPETVKIAGTYGPIGMPNGHGPNIGDVTVASVAKVCSDLTKRLHDETANPMPKNTVPSVVAVDGIAMNAAQFLRLMAQAVVDPVPDAKLRVRMTYMYPGTAEIFPKTRAKEDTGSTWTFKPAPLQNPSQPTRASR